MPASAVLVALVVATWPVLAWPLRRRFGARAWMVPPLASLALLPFVAFGAMWASGVPVVDAMPFKCGTGDVALLFVALPLAGAALAVGAFWAVYVASPPGRCRVDATLRAAALLAIAGGTALAGTSVARSLRGPDADYWAGSLPRVADVPPEVQAAAFEHFAWSFYDVRRDEARDLWVVTQPSAEGRRPVLALGCALVPRTILPRDLRGLAPPVGWVGEAVAGLAAAALALGLARLLARRHLRRMGGVAATHLGEGWIAIDGDDGEGGAACAPLHAQEAVALPPGPVVVRVGGVAPSAYRGTGAPTWVRVVAVGTPSSVEDCARSIVTVGHTMALTIAALSCAPLTVA
jgi:hypothetical protein